MRDDSLAEVGDEALVAVRSLGPDVPVVVAPSRSLAVAEAAQWADIVILDGVLQTAPERAALALLAVDAIEPWGRAAQVPPCGDLRAPVGALQAAADAVVAIGEGLAHVDARVVSRGAWLDAVLVPWHELRACRIGLLCALGRPDRVLRSLLRHGIEPVVVVRGRDHGEIPAVGMRTHTSLLVGARAHAHVDLWLATAKCALHAGEHARVASVATIDYELDLSDDLRRKLHVVAHLDRGSSRQ